jgi:anaerobic selenocysteine-containing dehydrogenase
MDQRIKALENIPTIIRLGTRPVGLYERAVLSLPTCTWAEKSGVYENAGGVIQPFAQAIPAMEDTRSTGQIFSDLSGNAGRYNAAAARASMTGAGMNGYGEIAEPVGTVQVQEMEFAPL